VFKLTPTTDGRWQETTLYAFKGGADGSWVQGGVVFDPSGSLYGVTTFLSRHRFQALSHVARPLEKDDSPCLPRGDPLG